MPAGRPTDYTEEKANTILGMMVEGMSLRKICAADDMPDMSTVYRWLSKHKEFSNNYAKAQQDRTTAFAEELLEIADQFDNLADKLDVEHIQRAKLRIDTRKWIMSKMDPKRFGDKVEQTIQGPAGDDGKPTAILMTIVDPKA